MKTELEKIIKRETDLSIDFEQVIIIGSQYIEGINEYLMGNYKVYEIEEVYNMSRNDIIAMIYYDFVDELKPFYLGQVLIDNEKLFTKENIPIIQKALEKEEIDDFYSDEIKDLIKKYR